MPVRCHHNQPCAIFPEFISAFTLADSRKARFAWLLSPSCRHLFPFAAARALSDQFSQSSTDVGESGGLLYFAASFYCKAAA
jgi:hypothetical protein